MGRAMSERNGQRLLLPSNYPRGRMGKGPPTSQISVLGTSRLDERVAAIDPPVAGGLHADGFVG